MKPFIREIFIDMDDVLNTFTPFTMAWFDCMIGVTDYDAYDPAWGYDIVEAINVMREEEDENFIPYDIKSFWRSVPRDGWATVTKTDFCDGLIKACCDLVGERNVCILTAPTLDPDCAAGKMEWIYENLPKELWRNYCISPRKRFCSGEASILIDDKPDNIMGFEKSYRGGHGILVPRPWNDLRSVKPVGDYIMERLLNDFQYPLPGDAMSHDDDLPGQGYFFDD